MLANALSLLRAALAPAVLVSLRHDGDGPAAATLALMLGAGATDILDGLAARRLGQVSRLGRILDPLADKAFIGAVCLGLVAWRAFPAWLLALQVARDLAIVGAGALLLRSRQVVFPASLAGKAATWVMALTMLAHVVALPASLLRGLEVVAAGLVVLSGAGYGRQLARVLRGGAGDSGQPAATP